LNYREQILAAVMALGVVATAAHAAERVTLRNGFELRCNHHAEIKGRVRLYPTGDEQSYIEFGPKEIATVETVADEPVPVAVEAAAADGNAVDASNAQPQRNAMPPPVQSKDARLSEADLHEILAKASGAHDLDADLLASVVKAESGGNTRAVSRTGARGLMQLMPGTASKLGVPNAFDPQANVEGGTKYLRELLERYNFDLVKALAAYNAGPQRVEQFGGVPPYYETRAYVARIVRDFNKKKAAQQKVAAVTQKTAAQKNSSKTSAAKTGGSAPASQAKASVASRE
jgi:soluble lytic murein transglycosylase-like protein